MRKYIANPWVIFLSFKLNVHVEAWTSLESVKFMFVPHPPYEDFICLFIFPDTLGSGF